MKPPAHDSFELPADWGAEPPTLAAFLKARYTDLSWREARNLVSTGKLYADAQVLVDPSARMLPGLTYELHMNKPKQLAELAREQEKLHGKPGTRSPRPGVGPLLTEAHVLFQDAQLVVVNKPAGLSTVPFEDSETNSVDRQLARLLGKGGRPAPLFVVHRLDKETSGVLVFARTEGALRHLKNQFRFHTTERRYWALCRGHVRSCTLRSRLVRDRGDGKRGSVDNEQLGREAITHVELRETYSSPRSPSRGCPASAK